MEKRGPLITTTVPRRRVRQAAFRQCGVEEGPQLRAERLGGGQMLHPGRCGASATVPSKNVSARPQVRSMNWSVTTKVSGSEALPAARPRPKRKSLPRRRGS